MSMSDVKWDSNDTSARASQVLKHTDPTDGKDKYYLYYCSWDKTGRQCISVAVYDSPTGQFVDIGEPLVKSTMTKPNTSTFNDIDPTGWIETDENGEEHRYLAWGNGMFFICELNEDMISIKDLNGDGKITNGTDAVANDIITRTDGLDSYTEAPWLYKKGDDYYLFFAHKWRECMAYATTDDFLSGKWNITANSEDSVTLSQDTKSSDTVAASQTFKTLTGLDDKNATSFESVSQPGKYLTLQDCSLCLTNIMVPVTFTNLLHPSFAFPTRK